MTTLHTSSEALVVDVSCSKDELTVALDDGRTVSVPLAWFPRLLNGTAKQRKKWELIGGGIGIHWDEVDEDISVASLLQPERFMRAADQAMQPAPRSTRTGRKAGPSARKKRSARRG